MALIPNHHFCTNCSRCLQFYHTSGAPYETSDTTIWQLVINNSTIEYLTNGSGDPVFLIHGAVVGDGLRHLLTQPARSESDQLILYHRRGYVGSRAGEVTESSMQREAEDIRQLLRHLSIESAHLAGISFGGATALQLALEGPGLIRLMVLIEPALTIGESASDYQVSLQAGINRCNETNTTEVLDEFMRARRPKYCVHFDQRLPGVFDQAVIYTETAFWFDAPAFLNWQVDKQSVREMSIPVTSVLGGESEALSPRFGETHRLPLEWLPNCEGAIVSGGTHLAGYQERA